MDSAVVVEAVRSPVGRGRDGGALSSLHAVELLAQVLNGLLDRVDVDPGMVEDVLVGCVSQAADQAGCPGRAAWLAAGGPEHVPAATIDRRCGSSQQAVQFAAQAVMSGTQDVVVAAGVESMSRVPMGSARMGVDPFGPSVADRYSPGLVPQGISAELIAAKWGISREAMDAFALRSHLRSAQARREGLFDREIVSITLPDGSIVSEDETIREGSTLEGLGALRPAFESEEMATRFPDIRWSVTPGNSSQLSDGATAVLVMSEGRASKLGLEPMARLHSFAVVGSDPLYMLTGPIPATEKLVARARVSLDEVAHFEVNEAFASVPMAWQQELGVDDDRLNPRGGAISLGHPLGASGTRLMTTMLHALWDDGGRYGLQVMCEGTGMANATLVENLRATT